LPASRLRRERASEVRVNKARKRKELEEVPEQRPKKKARANLKQREGFISASSRAKSIRTKLGLRDDVPEERMRLQGDDKNNKIKCCKKWMKNDSDTISKHLASDHHQQIFEIYAKVLASEGRGNLDVVLVPQPRVEPQRVGPPKLDEHTASVRENYVRHTIISGIPINSMDGMREFNTVHYDFSLARMSDMADNALPVILAKEKEKLRLELKNAKTCVIVFDGTTHSGEESFFVARYRMARQLFVKCIAAIHADKSMDGPTLCGIFKHLAETYGLKLSSDSNRDGT
jgi:hypothetical protein